MKNRLSLLILLIFGVSAVFAQRAPVGGAVKTVTVVTEPSAFVWVDNYKRGLTGKDGKLAVKIGAASKQIRVRAVGFKEATAALTPASRGEIKLALTPTTDSAELIFQKAETWRETAKTEADKRKIEEQYKNAIKLRPKYPEAYVGLARLYLEAFKDTAEAMEAIKQARKLRPGYAEASTVEGRILREDADDEGAITAFQRAIKEAGGYQPEALTGLALLYREQEEFELAIKSMKIAIAQLYDSEPVLYYELGEIYYRQQNYPEAIKAYEKYAAVAPTPSDAASVRSIIEQIKKEMRGQ
jgi:tetratricopeptide (TPR) repeat protein